MPDFPILQTWRGEYGYQFAGAASDSVPFEMRIRLDDDRSGRFTGTLVERQTFGDAARGGRLTARVEGRFARDQILFLKTYSGVGMVRHAVAYAGYLDQDNARVDTGGWILQRDWHGWFRMRRDLTDR